MMKRYIAFALCAAFLASLAVSFSFAGDDEPAVDSNIFVTNSDLNVDVEIEANGISAQRAGYAALVLSRTNLVSGGPAEWELATDAVTEMAPGHAPQTGGDPSKGFCTGAHDIITTTAYYTQHMMFNTDPRCVVYTVSVDVCTKCTYMKTTLISTERVSYCHPINDGGTKGDVNRDGRINAKDVTALMKHIAGATMALGATFDSVAADMDASGRINARDVTLLMKKIVKR